MDEDTKETLRMLLRDNLVKRHKLRPVMKIGDREYFRDRKGRSAMIYRDHKGDVKLERLDQ